MVLCICRNEYFLKEDLYSLYQGNEMIFFNLIELRINILFEFNDFYLIMNSQIKVFLDRYGYWRNN